ncbi:MAG: biopolymer transporter ExbD, partial [Opitutales bacterium]|nr:biopolymer transporter ExbD [Opitutales bacterium]
METLKKILADEDEVDLTPMIDVTFLLLIYFMVTTMLKQPEAELSIQLPGKPQSSDVTPMDMLNVKIGDQGEVYLNGSEIEDGLDFEMPDLVSNLKVQKGMRDQLISSGAKTKAEAELKVQIESSGIAEHQSAV